MNASFTPSKALYCWSCAPNASSILAAPRSFCSILVRISILRLSCDPFTDISWTVPKFDSVCFAHCQKFYGFSVHDEDVFEIDDDCAFFLFQQGTQRIPSLLRNSSTDAQHSAALSDNSAVDSAGHCCFYPSASLLLEEM